MGSLRHGGQAVPDDHRPGRGPSSRGLRLNLSPGNRCGAAAIGLCLWLGCSACPTPAEQGAAPTPAAPLRSQPSATPPARHLAWQPPPDPRRPLRDPVVTGLPPSAQKAPSSAPSILLITIDTIRADRLSLHGSRRPTSPWLDALAEKAWVFDRAISPSPWTWPSMVSIATSLYPSAHGVTAYDAVLCEDAQTLAEALHGAGWVTGFAGANHYLERPEGGYRQGFEFYWDRGTEPGERILEHAEYFLDGVKPEEPFFLHLHFYDPHCPYTPSSEALSRVTAAPFGPTGTGPGRALPPIAPALTDDKLCHVVPPIDFSLPEKDQIRQPRGKDRQQYLDAYDAELAHTDALLSRLEALLVDRGRWDNLVVGLTGDHGEEFGEHGRLGHGRSVYRETTWVPFVVRPPLARAEPARRIAAPVSGIDLAPTLLALAGQKAPSGWAGRDLAPVARGESAAAASVFSETDFETSARMVDRGSHRIVVSSDLPAPQIFDASTDPMDLRPLSPAPGSPDAALLKDAVDELAVVQAALSAGRRCAAAAAPANPAWIEALRTSGYLGATSTIPAPPVAP